MTRDEQYRLLSFCVMQSLPEGTLLYNDLTKEMLFFPPSESYLSEEFLPKLVGKWFFVPASFDEYSFSKQITEIGRPLFFRKNKLKAYTILTTTACNARCFYCFEKGAPILHMSTQTARNTAEYILSQYHDGEDISLHWFGGEPLCNTGAIDIICSELKRQGIPFSSRITTNGYLLTKETIRKAIDDWNLRKVQITLDGTEQIYNAAKAFVYPDVNAYQTVLRNLKDISQTNIALTVRFNADTYNAGDLFALADELAAQFIDCSKVYLSIVPLMNRVGAYPLLRNKTDSLALYSVLSDLLRYVEEKGFSVGSGLSRSVKVACCCADSPNAIVIMPDGSLRRCEHIKAGNPVGALSDAASLSVGMWTEYWPETAYCRDCPLFSSCLRLKNCEEHCDCSEEHRQWKTELLRAKMRFYWKRFRKYGSTAIENA